MNHSNPPEVETLTRPQVLVAMAFTALILLVVAKVWQYFGHIQRLSLSFSLRDILIGLGIATGITLVSGLIYSFWPAYRRSADFYLELVIKPLIWADLIWLGLLPGLSEELLFRGVMLPALGFGALAIFISSLLFGVLHLSGLHQWPYMLWATLVGVILGVSAIKTGNLFVPILAHVITNFVSGCLWKWENAQN